MSERVVDVDPGLVRGQERNGRCVYDKQAKRELVRRCQQPGVSLAARAHGLNANLLRKWVTMASTRRGSVASVAPMLLSVITQPVPESAPRGEGHLEGVLPGGARSASEGACRPRRCRS